jgi:hypothetical protein
MHRALLVWLLLLIVAVANGALREGLITPRFGEAAGHVVSTLTLCAAILAAAWATIRWIGVAARRDAVRVGGLWVLLTLAFELLAGHYLFGAPWQRLLADYDVLRGHIWILVPVTTALAPLVAARLRGARRGLTETEPGGV